MKARRKRAWLAALLSLGALAALAWPGAVSAASDTPGLKLLAPERQTIYRYGRHLPLELDAWAAATGGDFELRVARADYDSPIEAAQVDSATGDVLRELPAEKLSGWFGLARFARATVRRPDGTRAAGGVFDFCPNSWNRQRVDDTGPELPRYPQVCGGYSPFTKAAVSGIDGGWAARIVGDEGEVKWVRLRSGKYSVTVRITKGWADLLEIAPEDAVVEFELVVRKARPMERFRTAARGLSARPDASSQAADLTSPPDPATLPDLVALPPFALTTHRRGNRDFLAFATTPWNAGPAPLVVEGFRRRGEAVMDAYQYFRDETGAVVGRAEVGDMRFHPHPDHNHWHFLQFARFTLHDASSMEVVRSRKQAFCLVPTDAIDLTVERAAWQTWGALATNCGSEGALWVREVLPAGWGDTYYQYVPGQSFNITTVPNGWYYAQVEVNPDGALYETDLTNNVESRFLYLGGRPGKRWTVVTPWHGIED
jgi:hypothetical protein